MGTNGSSSGLPRREERPNETLAKGMSRSLVGGVQMHGLGVCSSEYLRCSGEEGESQRQVCFVTRSLGGTYEKRMNRFNEGGIHGSEVHHTESIID